MMSLATSCMGDFRYILKWNELNLPRRHIIVGMKNPDAPDMSVTQPE